MKRAQAKILQLKTKALIASTALILAGIGIAASVSAASSIAGRLEWSGVDVSGIVTDTACATTHARQLRSDAACVRHCVELGADYAITVNKKVYVLKGHPLELNEFAGEGVLVRGELVGRDTIQVESVTPWMIETVRSTDQRR